MTYVFFCQPKIFLGGGEVEPVTPPTLLATPLLTIVTELNFFGLRTSLVEASI